jgi:hypothetical protein
MMGGLGNVRSRMDGEHRRANLILLLIKNRREHGIICDPYDLTS